MACSGPRFNLRLLALYAAIFVILGDLMVLLAVYQEYRDSATGRSNGQNNGNDTDSTILSPLEIIPGLRVL
ncbi:MAG: hypothetical protein N2376_09405 [Clostridia bacterium]|nr:hypothetical protein [Clostridia bacterium]